MTRRTNRRGRRWLAAGLLIAASLGPAAIPALGTPAGSVGVAAAAAGADPTLTLIGQTDLGSGPNANLTALGTTAFVGSWGTGRDCSAPGVRIVDLSDPTDPRVVAATARYPGTTAEHVVVRRLRTPACTGDCPADHPVRSAASAGLAALIAGGLVAGPAGPDRRPGQAAVHLPGGSASLATATGGLVAASHPLAAEAGAAILRRGGNAIDAAAATAFALGVVEPQSSGLGGGAFLLVHLAGTGETIVLDGRETAPAAATPDQFLDAAGRPRPFGVIHTEGTAVGVPGLPRLLETAVARYGRLATAETLEPAIELADGGFPVNHVLAADAAANAGKLAAWPASAAVFLPGDRPIRAGEWLRQPDLAHTLRAIADRGADAFYSGEIAAAIVAAQAARGGRLTEADLAAYAVAERRPLWGAYRDLTVATMPPPSAGGVFLLQALALVEPFGLSDLGFQTPAGLHLQIEALRLAAADRTAHLADADFAAVPVRGLLHPAYLGARQALIDPGRANPRPGPGDPWPFEAEATAGTIGVASAASGDNTTHLVTVDAEGNVVSLTSTIESVWGSGILVPGHGFLLNNELTDFDSLPGGPNQVEPGKRPRSNMTPTIVFHDGTPVLALGSPGGPTIPGTVFQVLINAIDHGLDLQAAIDAGRIDAPAYPAVRWEAGIPAATRSGLAAFGHQPASGSVRLGSVQAAQQTAQGWTGAADPRREGTVIVVPDAAAIDVHDSAAEAARSKLAEAAAIAEPAGLAVERAGIVAALAMLTRSG